MDALLNTNTPANLSHSVQLSASVSMLYRLYAHAQSDACDEHEEFNTLLPAFVERQKRRVECNVTLFTLAFGGSVDEY